MLQYRPLAEVIRHPGLRLVLVQGMPSPWGQAAKTIFEMKKLDYVVGPQVMGDANVELERWSGVASGPVVAWKDEKPIHKWTDILYLAERLAPQPGLIPKDPQDRVRMFGLAHEICGEMGIGWNRRLQMFAPAMDSEGSVPEAVAVMARRYRYSVEDARAAGQCIAVSLNLLAEQLKSQYARGIEYFVGDRVSALDIYWVAFANLLDPLPKAQCPIPDDWRPALVPRDPVVLGALDPLLLRHRDKIFRECFRDPMEL